MIQGPPYICPDCNTDLVCPNCEPETPADRAFVVYGPAMRDLLAQVVAPGVPVPVDDIKETLAALEHELAPQEDNGG